MTALQHTLWAKCRISEDETFGAVITIIFKRVGIFVVDNGLKIGFKLLSMCTPTVNITASDKSATEGAYRLAI